jgi:hypothetical protein
MAETARARADEEEPELDAHAHGSTLSLRDHAEFEAGLKSWITAIERASPELKETVIHNAAKECAGYFQKGFSKQIAVDGLNEAVQSAGLGLHAEDLIDHYATTTAIVTNAIASEHPLAPAESHDRSRLKPIPWSDLDKLPKRQALIEGLLDCTALSVVFGPSGCGKTFFALDLAVRVALGRPWRGRAVVQGTVVYVAAEGGYGMSDRLMAFSCKYGVDPKDVPFYVIPEPIDLCKSDGDLNLLIERLRQLPAPVRLVVVDTVSRALAGGNENSPDHMGGLVRRCDMLRKSTGAHVMLVHHTGKDTNQGARGHSSLRAAVDTEIEMTWDKTGQSGLATVTKQRDSRTEGKFAFTLDDVDVDLRDDGTLVTSCVVVPGDEITAAKGERRERLPKAAQTALRALREAIHEHGIVPSPADDIPSGVRAVTVDQWRDRAYAMTITRSTAERAKQQAFKRAFERLIKEGRVSVWNGQAWLTPSVS